MQETNQQTTARLVGEAEAALRRGDTAGALDILSRAESMAAGDASVHLAKALAHRAAGDRAAALECLDRALAREPRNFLALLSKGWLLEQEGSSRKAALVYQAALAVAPPPDRMPPAIEAPLARAREAVTANRVALKAYLSQHLGNLRGRVDGESLERFDESVDILTGQARAYVQQPLLFHYPRLPAIPFYDPALFPWLSGLEAHTATIQEELASLLDEDGTDRFAPYIAYPAGAPLDQWGELNHSRRWSSFFLWRDGVRQDDACTRCPATASILEALPMARQAGLAPTAMFSALEAHTRIPPHTGSTNVRAIVHLPLVLPGPCRFRVGNVTREWRMHEAWVFDDTLEHEAWNDANDLRVILIFDVWNPYLSAAERELVTEMLRAKKDFQAMDTVDKLRDV